MVLEIAAIGFMFATILVRWFTTSALQSKRSRLSEVNEKNGDARQRFKIAVSEVNMSDREITKLERKIKGHERRVPQLQKEMEQISGEAKKQADLNKEKLRLAQELQKKKGG